MARDARPPLFSLRVPPPRMVRRLLGAGGWRSLVLLWWLATSGGAAENRLISPVMLPSPREVLASFPSLLNERALLQSIAATLKRVLIGFGLAIVVGVPIGIARRIVAGGRSGGRAARAFRPKPAGGGADPADHPVVRHRRDAEGDVHLHRLRAVRVLRRRCAPLPACHDRYVETAQTLGASPRQIVSKVLVALALPDIYGSLRHLFGMAFGYIMLAELINASTASATC